MRKVWIVQRSPGNAYTTFRGPSGEEQRVPVRATRIGPFDSIPAAADWLAANSQLHSSYELQEEIAP